MEKKVLFFVCMGIWLHFLSTYSQVFKNSDLRVSKLPNDDYVIETADNVALYLIVGSKRSLLIDTGTSCDSLDRIISLITDKPVSVVLTHGHGDHSGNIGFFREIFMHPDEKGVLTQEYNGKINYINEGYIFDLGGKKIEVKHMPAHTPGSIILVEGESGSCYTGDAFGSPNVWLQLRPIAPMKTYINSCSEMLALMDSGIDSIYCGHYPYVKKALNKTHIASMKKLAESIENGSDINTEPFLVKIPIGADNPMIARDGEVAIVYDPEHIK